MNENISPEAQKVFVQLQQMQKQLQNIDMQRQSLTYQKMEIEKALEEVKREGKRIVLACFKSSFSAEIRQIADDSVFIDDISEMVEK